MIKPAWAIAGVALLGTAVAGVVIVTSPGGEEEAVQQVETPTPSPGRTLTLQPGDSWVSPEVAEDAKKPRFQGEVLGVWLWDPLSNDSAGSEFDLQEKCPSGVDAVKDHPAVPPAPPYLPAGASIAPGTAALNLANPSALVCRDNGLPVTSGRRYLLPPIPDKGLFPEFAIGRLFSGLFGVQANHSIDAPHDRIQVGEFAGREAIVIAPIVPDEARFENLTEIIFPETTGLLRIQVIHLPLSEGMKIAESLAPLLPLPAPTAPGGASSAGPGHSIASAASSAIESPRVLIDRADLYARDASRR